MSDQQRVEIQNIAHRLSVQNIPIEKIEEACLFLPRCDTDVLGLSRSIIVIPKGDDDFYYTLCTHHDNIKHVDGIRCVDREDLINRVMLIYKRDY